MTNLFISETHVNATKHHVVSEIEPYETWADVEQLGKLYKSLQSEYGRCISSMYIDHTDKVKTQKIGWVFLSRDTYEDTKETYLREVWISVFIKNEETGRLEYMDMK
jgi:hypothetical protein